MFRAMTKGKYEITLEEWLYLFQPKEIGYQSVGLYTFSVRAGSEKIVQGLPDDLRSDWKTHFFYIPGTGRKHDENCLSLADVKYFSTRPAFFSKFFL